MQKEVSTTDEKHPNQKKRQGGKSEERKRRDKKPGEGLWQPDTFTDVLGSYTGNPHDDDRPIQDADDL